MELKSEKEIGSLRVAGRLAAELLDACCREAKPGITTSDLDVFAAEWIKSHGAKPAFLNYRGFPAHICVSINEEVVHGIPGSKKIRVGDIVGIDVGLFYDGWCGDTARTVAIGQISADAQKLLEVSRQSLEQAIQAATMGNRLGDVSNAMQSVVESAGFNVVRHYGGHGIGRQMHEDPHVPCLGTPGTGMRLKDGLVLALEVMANRGVAEVSHKPDGWTVLTEDGSLSAHFEHMVAITSRGTEVLTRI
ncbi:MAG: type I methionyl aminopeptidase [Elusimicrobia bacterium]|nr:type I methionyl aminopeptidase [Elusimicrobiota bacterium]MBI3012767.1 type I methionyl aminopeptidase [Elusimicrobiota bacterium]